MEGDSSRKKVWVSVAILVLLALAALIVWLIVVANHPKNNKTAEPPASQVPSSSEINDLVSYDLPSGWFKIGCSDALTLIVPSGQTRPSCTNDVQNWPIKITLSPQDITDCNQIKVNNQQVTKHICRSQFISGQKVIDSSTTYNDKSFYGRPTKVSDYYFNTRGKTIQFEYIDNLSNDKDDFQSQFDQFVNTVKVKNT